jgi:predicted RNase H-like HicB family nuclease
MMANDLDYYRSLPYERLWEVRADEGERYFIVRLRDIPQVSGAGETKDEAVGHLREAFDDYVTWRLDDGLEVASPARGYATQKPQMLRGLESTPSSSTVRDTATAKESDTDHAAAAYERNIDCLQVACV